MNIVYPVPIAVYTLLSLFFLLFSGRAKGLKSVLVASTCGVWIISFTRGAPGAIWIAPLLLFLIGSVVIWRPTGYAFGSRVMTRLMYMMFFIFFIGVVIGSLRYDPGLEAAKEGAFRTILGMPLNFLIAAYRIQTVAFLFLAFAVPLRYSVDRELFLQCLKLIWIFSMVLAVLTILDYAGFGDFAFSTYREEGELGHLGVLGFNRAGHGKMLVTGIFMCFAMTQLTRNLLLKTLGYISIPLLLTALLFSFSRSSYVVLIVAAMSLAVTLGGARALKGILMTFFGVIVIYIILMQFPELRERFLFIGGQRTAFEASAGRIAGWTELLSWLLESPGILAVGAGFQNFSYFVKIHAEIGELESGHNNFLHILVELGILGFLAFIGWLVSIFYWLVSWRRTMTDKIDKMMPGIFASLMIGIVASCMFSETLYPVVSMVPWMVHFCLILGICTSYYRTQMAELNAAWEMEYYESEEQLVAVGAGEELC